MRRREFITLLGGASFAWPFAARAQQSRKQNRIAFVHSGIPAEQLTESAGPLWVRRFYETLRKLGDLEGDNLVVERYSAEGRTDHLTALAGTIVSRKPDVIVTNWKTENDRPRHSTTCLCRPPWSSRSISTGSKVLQRAP
jgi:putative tryptophan/tyrosine transport system substrate-binding protein